MLSCPSLLLLAHPTILQPPPCFRCDLYKRPLPYRVVLAGCKTLPALTVELSYHTAIHTPVDPMMYLVIHFIIGSGLHLVSCLILTQELLLQSFHLQRMQMSDITTQINNQFLRQDFHLQASLFYWLQSEPKLNRRRRIHGTHK